MDSLPNRSCASRISAFTTRDSSRGVSQCPPLLGVPAGLSPAVRGARPGGVLLPRFPGGGSSAACRALRSGVQPLLIGGSPISRVLHAFGCLSAGAWAELCRRWRSCGPSCSPAVLGRAVVEVVPDGRTRQADSCDGLARVSSVIAATGLCCLSARCVHVRIPIWVRYSCFDDHTPCQAGDIRQTAAAFAYSYTTRTWPARSARRTPGRAELHSDAVVTAHPPERRDSLTVMRA